MQDGEIIRLYHSGEEERAFSEIVRSYSERLYWHVRRFVCCHEDADDLVQEIFVKIWAALPSFREEAQLMAAYGLDGEHIAEAARKAIFRK